MAAGEDSTVSFSKSVVIESENGEESEQSCNSFGREGVKDVNIEFRKQFESFGVESVSEFEVKIGG